MSRVKPNHLISYLILRGAGDPRNGCSFISAVYHYRVSRARLNRCVTVSCCSCLCAFHTFGLLVYLSHACGWTSTICCATELEKISCISYERIAPRRAQCSPRSRRVRPDNCCLLGSANWARSMCEYSKSRFIRTPTWRSRLDVLSSSAANQLG